MKLLWIDHRPRSWGRARHLVRGGLIPFVISVAFVGYVVLGELGLGVSRTDRFYWPFIVAFVVVQLHMAIGFFFLAAVASGRVPGLMAVVVSGRTFTVQWGPIPKVQVHRFRNEEVTIRIMRFGGAGAWLLDSGGNPTIAVPFLDAASVSHSDETRLRADFERLLEAQNRVTFGPAIVTPENPEVL